MIIKKWKKDNTWYRMIADFKYGLVYTRVIQITLENPWLIPKYEDNFAGIEGLRLYGWLFFYFGTVYYGSLYPAENETSGGFLDKNGKRWFVISKDKNPNFINDLKKLKKQIKSGYHITWERTYLENGNFNVTAIIKK